VLKWRIPTGGALKPKKFTVFIFTIGGTGNGIWGKNWTGKWDLGEIWARKCDLEPPIRTLLTRCDCQSLMIISLVLMCPYCSAGVDFGCLDNKKVAKIKHLKTQTKQKQRHIKGSVRRSPGPPCLFFYFWLVLQSIKAAHQSNRPVGVRLLKGDKVALGPSRPTRLELIPVSVAWSNWEYCYSPLDGMLVHRRVTPKQYVADTHLNTWVETDNVGQS